MTGSWTRFARHYGEMWIAMLVGMGVFSLLLAVALPLFGTRLTDLPIDVRAALMAVEMTIPMVAWMHFKHRMAVGRSVEMTASMIVPSLAALALFWAGALGDDGVMLVQHLAMIPAMLAVMLWRFDAYSGAHA